MIRSMIGTVSPTRDGPTVEGIGGYADRPGFCAPEPVTEPSGTLSAEQRRTLQTVAEAEKLTHDLYADFAARYDSRVFADLAVSRTRHLATLRSLLARYGVPDPTSGMPAGRFSDREPQATYDRLLAEGGDDRAAALRVAMAVTHRGARILRLALYSLTAPDVRQAYRRLLLATWQQQRILHTWCGR